MEANKNLVVYQYFAYTHTNIANHVMHNLISILHHEWMVHLLPFIAIFMFPHIMAILTFHIWTCPDCAMKLSIKTLGKHITIDMPHHDFSDLLFHGNWNSTLGQMKISIYIWHCPNRLPLAREHEIVNKLLQKSHMQPLCWQVQSPVSLSPSPLVTLPIRFLRHLPPPL